MLEKDFYKNCDETLLSLSQQLENYDKNSKLDVEYSDGILKILIEESGKTFVINRHSASQKIWYSSPFSGADYFFFDEEKSRWLDSKGEELSVKLFNEIKLNIKL